MFDEYKEGEYVVEAKAHVKICKLEGTN